MDLDHDLFARSGVSVGSADDRPPYYKAIGIGLAIGSGLFIGTSFVMKKVGLLRANEKYNEVAGEGYGYLKNGFWWGGMILMIIGEICNFVAYAFTDAILVTPLGALSVVITTVLSAIFLKERLSMVGKVSCFLCIIGSVVIVMNAPHNSAVADIQEMRSYVIAPGFLSFAGVVIVGSAICAIWAAPKWGSKNMLVYISICSWIGGLSVVATQGLGAGIIAWISGKPQYKEWFFWVLLVFVITTLLVEIIYLNKALNIFNAALVTPTYYVYFTSTTIVTSAVLFQGFKGTVEQIVTVVLGFLTICSGVVLLQLSKSAKDVPDAAVFKGDLDQIQTIAEQEQPETEPKADAIRGAAALVRRFSTMRQKMEEEEFRRLQEEKRLEAMHPVPEDGSVPEYEWDGLRRRRTMSSMRAHSTTSRPPPTPPPHLQGVSPRGAHPPLGMSRFPDYDENQAHDDDYDGGSIFSSIAGTIRGRRRGRTNATLPSYNEEDEYRAENMHSPVPPVPLTNMNHASSPNIATRGNSDAHVHFQRPQSAYRGSGSRGNASASNSPGLTPTPPPHGSGTKRQFSFQKVFRNRNTEEESVGLVYEDGTRSSEEVERVNSEKDPRYS
ncbi:hypothetical protein N3K66_000323 [Trichothecium roseum]|uniref:Uncharacterized protein n=1 Tax=Trichothecium roseum TaxID=47278 RepID=A0ACC0VC62_9HYPO|nr:hypothetical protein N3K66_000323 [Trichothecium roseum]